MAFYGFWYYLIEFLLSNRMLFTDLKIQNCKTETVKKDYFTRNLSSPMFFEINTSMFQEVFLDILKKLCRKEF